jgi:hypothetical protein
MRGRKRRTLGRRRRGRLERDEFRIDFGIVSSNANSFKTDVFMNINNM